MLGAREAASRRSVSGLAATSSMFSMSCAVSLDCPARAECSERQSLSLSAGRKGSCQPLQRVWLGCHLLDVLVFLCCQLGLPCMRITW